MTKLHQAQKHYFSWRWVFYTNT